jgi:ADP-ribose pyrophosphatase
MTDDGETKVNYREVFRGHNFAVRQEDVSLPDGGIEVHEHVWRTDGTRIIGLDQAQRVLLTREYRHELDAWDWRVPGGKIDSGETPEEAAAREFREEAGFEAASMRFLWATTPDSTVRYQRFFFLATDLSEVEADRDAGERMTVHWMGLDEACAKALDGEIREEISALALLRLRHGLDGDGASTERGSAPR